MFYQQFCREEFDRDGNLTDFSLQYPDNYNFGYDVIDRIAEETPEKRALVWQNTEGDERTFTFGELSRLSNRAANAFLAHGIKKGDRVMLILKRSYEYWYAVVALHKIGAVAVPASHMLTLEDLVYRINKIEISAVVTISDDSLVELLKMAQAESPSLQTIWTTRQCGGPVLSLADEMEKMSEKLVRIPTAASDIMIVYFTSGTTGYPKAVAHDHSYSLAHILTAKYWQQVVDGGLHLTVADTGWGKASWGKIYGQWLIGSAVMVFDFDSFDSRQMTTVMNHHKITTFCAPPTVYRYMVRRGNLSFPNMKHATSAGEYLPPEVSRLFEEKTGIAIAEGYGQTESTLMIAHLAGTKIRRGSLGKPTPFYHAQIIKEDGTAAEVGESGEIVVSPRKNRQGIMLGYLNGSTINDEPIHDGFLHTGDSAWQDEEGYFWYNGRMDDVIKTGGLRIGPVEIENIVLEHPLVSECSVVGIPDPLRGQAIKAVVVLVSTAVASEELKKEIRQFANNQLAVFKHIRLVDFVDENVQRKTPQNKLLKRAASAVGQF